MTTTEKYYGVVETAQLIRDQLKRKFPDTTFSVRSSRYAGGASIDIRWKFGPTAKKVEEITRMYEGKGFDSMTDCSYIISYWLDKDGDVTLRETGGGINPTKEYSAPSPDAVAVRFGSSYVHTRRSFGDSYDEEEGLVNKIARDLCVLQHVEYKDQYTKLFGEHDLGSCTESANTLLRGTEFRYWEEYAGVRFTHDEEKEDHWDIFRIIMKGNPPNTKTDTKKDGLISGQKKETGQGDHNIINAVADVIVRENPAHNGLEMVFPSKPGREILIKLKAAGWRWSHTGGLWYHKNTVENRQWSEDLIKSIR